MDEEILDHLVRILSSTASQDALKILMATSDGIESSTKAIRDLGLTQKRYYTWLKRLIDAGLIEKKGNVYKQTMLGRVCYDLGEELSKAVSQRSKLEIVDKLVNSNQFSLEEAKRIVSISENDLANLVRSTEVYSNQGELFERLADLIDNAEKRILLASYYRDFKVTEAIVRASKRGVEMAFIAGHEEYDTTEIIRIFLSSRMMKIISDFFRSSNNKKVDIRRIAIPYSFCVIDEKYAIFELPNPESKDFIVAFVVEDEEICRRLTGLFNGLFEKGEEFKILRYIKGN